MSRYLVTGATGFLGRHLVRQLREAEHDVVALCRPAGKPGRAGGHNPDHEALEALGVTLATGDVTDGDSVRAAAAGCDGAFHCAGKVSRAIDDAKAMFRVHVEGTKVTLDALRQIAAEQDGPFRVVVASTSGVIAVSDDPDDIASEDHATPEEAILRWPYYRTKLYAEQAALERNGDGLEVVCLNPSLLLGPGDLRGSSTDDVRKLLEGKIPFCPGGGVAFVDARDTADAFIKAMHKGKPGRRYLINAANMTLATFFGRLARISGVKAPPLSLPRTNVTLAGVGAELISRVAKALDMPSPLDRVSAEMAQYFWYCDSGRAQRELGWRPRDPGETLADTVRDLQDRGVVWPT